MKKIKLGILQVNHDKSEDIGDMFPDDAHRFRDLFDGLKHRFEYKVYMTIGNELPENIDDQDAYLIPGSPLSVKDNHSFSKRLYDFIRLCDERQKPLIGSCFGHQAIAVALGGIVEKSKIKWNVGIEETKFTNFKPWMTPEKNLNLYVFHEDQVTRLPSKSECLGYSDNCAIACFSKGNHIFTTQSHPEFDEKFMRAIVDKSKQMLGSKIYAGALNSLSQKQDGKIFSEWCGRFFEINNLLRNN